MRCKNVLHALGAAGPVAVVEVKPFALEDEGADAILDKRIVLAFYTRKSHAYTAYLALGDRSYRRDRHRCGYARCLLHSLS